MSRRWGSNPRPANYELAATATELLRQMLTLGGLFAQPGEVAAQAGLEAALGGAFLRFLIDLFGHGDGGPHVVNARSGWLIFRRSGHRV